MSGARQILRHPTLGLREAANSFAHSGKPGFSGWDETCLTELSSHTSRGVAMRVVRMKNGLVASGLLLSVVLAFAGLRAQSPAQTPAVGAPAVPLAEQQYKNIQTLKGVPADQIIPAMQFISASLGVECEYCHVRGANEKDDKKPKLRARQMIAMMMDINEGNFKGHREVTCYSCHRGAAVPVGTPTVATEDSKPELRAVNAANEEKPAVPSANQILDKYLAALGGAEALQKITSRTE